MTRPIFLEGVAVALVASVTGSVLYTVLNPVLGGESALRALVACAGLAYVSYLLGRSGERVGRVTTAAAWVLGATFLWVLSPPLSLYLLLHLGMLWLVRSLYFYAGVLPALTDLGLTGLGVAAALWAAIHTGSMFLSLWCFFLIQALFVAIPARLGNHTRTAGQPQPGDPNDGFQRAHRAAEAALRTLSSIH